MREILFKAKSLRNKWVYGYYWANGLGNHFIKQIIEEDGEYSKYITEEIEVIPETICQYTGLNDKDGKKIFENDVIRLDDEYRRLISFADAKTEDDLVRKDCLVGFKNGSFMFCRNKYVTDYFDSCLWLSNEHCEVIGNIFDDEEKLK